ncbi:MAG TPA: nickel-binding protein [Kofleriaceae bacterium]|nr:nickel-binding protein [Kofleriaceae bacterium]
MARIILEQAFDPPLSPDDEAAFARRLDECLRIRNGAWCRTALSIDRRRMVCEFEAPDAESVREALRSASIPFERVWSASVYAVEDFPDHKAKLDALLAKRKTER